VSFYQGTTLLGMSSANTGGVATLSVRLTTLGANTITASYSGSCRLRHVDIESPVAYGRPGGHRDGGHLLEPGAGIRADGYPQRYRIVAFGRRPSGIPGSVSFYSGSTLLGSSPLAGGAASFSAVLLSLGPNAVTAVYSGSADYAASDVCRLIRWGTGDHDVDGLRQPDHPAL
jgi:hypothetical protein